MVSALRTYCASPKPILASASANTDAAMYSTYSPPVTRATLGRERAANPNGTSTSSAVRPSPTFGGRG